MTFRYIIIEKFSIKVFIVQRIRLTIVGLGQ
jgi:hypothetical protein